MHFHAVPITIADRIFLSSNPQFIRSPQQVMYKHNIYRFVWMRQPANIFDETPLCCPAVTEEGSSYGEFHRIFQYI